MHRSGFRVLAVTVTIALALTVALGGGAEAKQKKGKKALEAARAASALASELQANTTQYVGSVDGTNAYIAVIARGTVVEVYVCDGADLIAWPIGEAKKSGDFTAESATGVKVSGAISDDQASGTVTLPDGSEHAFTAGRATGEAGLYERVVDADSRDAEELAATIVLSDGTQRGGLIRAVKVCLAIASSIKNYEKQMEDLLGPGGAGPAGDEDLLANLEQQRANFASHGCPPSLVSA